MENRNQFIKDFNNYIDKFLNLNGKDWKEVLKENVLKPDSNNCEWFAELYLLQNKYGYDFDMFGTYLEEKKMTNTGLGQFFTPMHIAKLMSCLNFPSDIQDILDSKYITVSDPCCGSRVIIMTEANSSVKSKVLKLLPKLKTEETGSLCVA